MHHLTMPSMLRHHVNVVNRSRGGRAFPATPVMMTVVTQWASQMLCQSLMLQCSAATVAAASSPPCLSVNFLCSCTTSLGLDKGQMVGNLGQLLLQSLEALGHRGTWSKEAACWNWSSQETGGGVYNWAQHRHLMPLIQYRRYPVDVNQWCSGLVLITPCLLGSLQLLRLHVPLSPWHYKTSDTVSVELFNITLLSCFVP